MLGGCRRVDQGIQERGLKMIGVVDELVGLGVGVGVGMSVLEKHDVAPTTLCIPTAGTGQM